MTTTQCVGDVVLVDAVGTLEPVASALAGLPGVEVVQADALPRGRGIIALLVAKERVGADQMRELPDLRIVAATSAGYDHLDLEAIAAAGAWATHCPGYCDQEVAEHAIAFALDLLRGVTLLDRAVRDGAWDYASAAPPRRVAGAVLGVVGLGRIGREVARRGVALGMQVLATDPAVSTSDLPGVTLTSLPELLRAADVVTLHALLNNHTRGLIGAAQLAAMRTDSYLVNCARAGLVDHQALGEALRAGRLAGCALDVLPREPPTPDQPELRWPRTLINPHAAWFSPQAATAPYRLAGEAVAAVLAGREPADALARPAPATAG